MTGTFAFPAADIKTLAATVVLNGSTSAIVNQDNDNALVNFQAVASTGDLTLQNGRILTQALTDFTTAGQVRISGSCVLRLTGGGKKYIQNGGATTLNGGTLATTSSGRVAINGGVLTGRGTVASILANNSSVVPGPNAAAINVTSDYNQTGSFTVEIGGTNIDTPDYDQLRVAGNVTLGGMLNVSLINGFVPGTAQTFVLIRNDGTAPVSGTFSNFAQGAPITLGGRQFAVNYAGGDGNDVVIADVGEVLGRVFAYRADPNSPSLPIKKFLSGIQVTLGNSLSTLTDAQGNYSFTQVPNGSYTLTAQPPTGGTFDPVSRNITVAGGKLVSQNFKNYVILGRVYKLNASNAKVGLAGASILLNGSERTATDANGFYAIPNMGHVTVRVKPVLSGFSFTEKTVTLPTSGIANISPSAKANFQGTSLPRPVSGNSSQRSF